MDIDSFLNSAEARKLTLPSLDLERGRSPAAVDALFHLPLLALAAMVIARQKPFATSVLGRRMAALLGEHFIALRRSPHRLETSLTLRRRCADALFCLEASGLVTVSDQDRIVALTAMGKKHLDRVMRDTGDLGFFVRQLRTSYIRSTVRGGNDEHQT